MIQFRTQMTTRIAQALEDLRQAHAAEDSYVLGIALGELESLARLAVDHGLPVDGVREQLARFGIALPGGPPPRVIPAWPEPGPGSARHDRAPAAPRLTAGPGG